MISEDIKTLLMIWHTSDKIRSTLTVVIQELAEYDALTYALASRTLLGVTHWPRKPE